MAAWPRRIRGALFMGVLWALSWAFAGLLIGIASTILTFLPWDAFFRIFDAPLPALGLPGFFGGILFSVVLGVAARHRRFDQLSLARFAGWGAVGGILVSLIPLTLGALGLASFNVNALVLTAAIAVALVPLSAASAAASLLVARRGAERQLPSGDSSNSSSPARSLKR